MKLLKDIRTYFMLVLFGSIGWLIVQMVIYPVLPGKYMILLAIVLLALALLLVISQYKTHKKMTRIFGKIVILILSLVLILVNFTYLKTMNAFNEMTGNVETDVVSVIVKKKSDIEYIDQLINSSVGMLSTGYEDISEVLDQIKEQNKNKVSFENYYGTMTLVKGLYDNEVSAIVINESYRGLIEDDFENFSENTRVIYSRKYQTTGRDVKNIDITKEPFSVYISGIDTYGTISTKSRSDVNMIVTVNPNTKQILMTSIPRDYYIPFKALDGEKDKLTHSGLFGVDETKDNVGDYFGIDIDYSFRVNFTSLIDIVDAIGGIDVDNPNAFRDFKQGRIHLNGKRALEFSRERYSFADGDRERGRNHMRVLTAIIHKVLSPEIIKNYMPLLNSVQSSFQTTLSNDQILSFIRMQVDDMSSWNIEQTSVTGTGAMLHSPMYGAKLSMMIPDDDSVKMARNRILQLYQ